MLWRRGKVRRERRSTPLSRYRDLLSRGPFRGFLFAGSLSFAAPTAVLVVLSWSLATAYPSTLPGNSQVQYAALALALLGLSATVPTLGAAIISGTLADRVARRRLMQLTNGLALLGTVGMMAVLIVRPSAEYSLPGPAGFYLPEWALLLFPLWALVSVGMTLFRPAFNASLPRLVSKADLGTANGLVYAAALSFSLIGLIGTPLLMAKFGNGWALILAVILFVATEGALLAVSANVDPPATGAPRRSFLSDAGDGYRYLWHRKELL
ncbi:MAG: MFS transporter, partial [Thermoplasmata archaeon]|nr:MFS transporter [Thermoplasmata archaeon]